MQDSRAAARSPLLVDIPVGGAYPRLVTKDTTVESDPERTDAADDSTPTNGAEPAPHSEGYYAFRRARYLEVIRGHLPMADFVRQAVADVDRRHVLRDFERE